MAVKWLFPLLGQDAVAGALDVVSLLGVHRAVGVYGRSGGDVGLQPFEAHGARAGTAQHLHERLLLHRLVPAF